MSDKKPPEQPAPSPVVDVADQILVGFDPQLGLLGPQAAREVIQATLHRLEKLPATTLKCFITDTPKGEPLFSVATLRLDKETVTLEELQKRLEAGDRDLAGISYFERNAPIAMAGFDDPLLGQQWALEKLGAAQPWTVAPAAGGKTIVAIIDSGLRRADGSVHEDLGAVEPVNFCQPPPFVVTTPGPPPIPVFFYPGLCLDGIDQDGHGTMLAGTIAAVPGNATGLASAVPDNWGISLMPIKFFDPDAPPNVGDAAVAIVYAAFRGAKVINASWHVGLGDHDRQTLRRAIRYARQKNCLVVAAAGNDGSDNSIYPTYPANYGSEIEFNRLTVLTVAATDRDDDKAAFSNYGKDIVDLAAPGVRILTTGRHLVEPARYPAYSGTSPAAAFVSAAAALVYALNPKWKPQDVIEHLLASADTIERLKLVCIGGRRLNIGRAVYGPLNITAPAGGATFRVGARERIEWDVAYMTSKLSHVTIEFSRDDGQTYAPLVGQKPNDGRHPWTPTAADRTTMGRLRIAPVEGNFPVVSKRFSVV